MYLKNVIHASGAAGTTSVDVIMSILVNIFHIKLKGFSFLFFLFVILGIIIFLIICHFNAVLSEHKKGSNILVISKASHWIINVVRLLVIISSTILVIIVLYKQRSARLQVNFNQEKKTLISLSEHVNKKTKRNNKITASWYIFIISIYLVCTNKYICTYTSSLYEFWVCSICSRNRDIKFSEVYNTERHYLPADDWQDIG